MAREPFSRPPKQPRDAGAENAASEPRDASDEQAAREDRDAGHRREGDRRSPGPAPLERYGELEIERHFKDDGRALILYTHRRD